MQRSARRARSRARARRARAYAARRGAGIADETPLIAQLLDSLSYAEVFRITDRQLELANSLTDALNKLEVLESSQAAESGRREVLLAARMRLAAAHRQAVRYVEHCQQQLLDAVLDLVLAWRAARDAQ